jgi:hypothetical protein
MLLKKIGMYEVMKDGRWKMRCNIGMIKALGRKNVSNHDAKGFMCSGKCHDMCSEELVPSSVQ